METPFGQLATLDLSDHELCRRIISLDKQSLAEGLVVESVFDQYLAAFSRDQGNDPSWWTAIPQLLLIPVIADNSPLSGTACRGGVLAGILRRLVTDISSGG